MNKLLKNKLALYLIIIGIVNWILVVFWNDIFHYRWEGYRDIFLHNYFNLFYKLGPVGYVLGLFINQAVFFGLIYILAKRTKVNFIAYSTFIAILFLVKMIGAPNSSSESSTQKSDSHESTTPSFTCKNCGGHSFHYHKTVTDMKVCNSCGVGN